MLSVSPDSGSVSACCDGQRQSPPDAVTYWWTPTRGLHDHPWVTLPETETIPTMRRRLEETHADCAQLTYSLSSKSFDQAFSDRDGRISPGQTPRDSESQKVDLVK